jgi:hypothetical protein
LSLEQLACSPEQRGRNRPVEMSLAALLVGKDVGDRERLAAVPLRRRHRPRPEGIITAGYTNKTARTISYRQGDRINRRALTAMLKQIIANNRAGGWRKLKPK